MKTPIQTAIEQIEKLAFEPMLGSSMKVVDIEDVRKVLQSLLSSEREAIEGAYKEGEAVGLNHCAETAQDFFNQKYTP